MLDKTKIYLKLKILEKMEKKNMENKMWKKGIVLGIMILFIGSCIVPSISGIVTSYTYTLDADFDEGVLVGVEYDTVHDQLQLSLVPTTYPVMWIANAGEDTVSKWDTDTNKELARYHT